MTAPGSGKEQMPPIVFSLLCIIWGSTWLAIKLGLEDSPPFLSSGVRFAVASCVLILMITFRGLRLSYSSKLWGFMALTGIFLGLGYGAIYWGEQYVSSGLSAVLFATLTLFVALFSHFAIPDEKLRVTKITGILVGFIGVFIIFSDSLNVEATKWWGCVALLSSSALLAASNVLIKRELTRVHPIVLTGVQMVLAACILLLLGGITERMGDFLLTPKSIGALLYLSLFGTVLAFVLYYWLMQRIQVTRLSLIVLITPIVAVFLGWLLLGEVVNLKTVSGSVLILGGVALALR